MIPAVIHSDWGALTVQWLAFCLGSLSLSHTHTHAHTLTHSQTHAHTHTPPTTGVEKYRPQSFCIRRVLK